MEILSQIAWMVLLFYIIDFVIYAVQNWRIVFRESKLEQYHNNEETSLLPVELAERYDAINLYAEEADSKIYVYKLTTDEYVASGKDIEEVSMNFHKRYPNNIGYFQSGEHAYIIGLEE